MRQLIVVLLAVTLLTTISFAGTANLSFTPEKAPYADPINKPDPNVILQGGDTVDDATVIGALPYSNSGTNVGYTDDYEEFCPYTSTSPDVVYEYTPGADMIVTISLCTGSAYDTKLFVYENEVTPGAYYACNDDACSTPNYPNAWVSEVVTDLTAGNTYYIIVDGYGGDAGDYTIDVTEFEIGPPGCCLDVTEPDEPWTFTTSDVEIGPHTVYDDFDCPDLTEVGHVQWWGLDLAYDLGWAECTEDPMDFNIGFYAPGDEPGAEVCSYTVTAVSNYTGIMYADVYELVEWNADLSPACAVNAGWLSIQGATNNGDSCVFLWGNSFDGNSFAYQEQGGVLVPLDYDLSKCLTEVPCCDIEIEPDYDPVIVPPGGIFCYEGTVGNPTTEPTATDVWGGVLYMGDFYQRFAFNNIPLNPGQYLSGHMCQYVPGFAPQGVYDYIAYCGDYPNNICDEASFPFEVFGARIANGAEEWSLEGGLWDVSVPTEYALVGSYPNPFNATTTITYQLPSTGNVNLEVYNLMGQKIATLVNGHNEAGEHSVSWDAYNQSSGVYFYKLEAGDKVITKRMTLLK